MSEQTPLAAYLGACAAFQEIQDSHEDPAYLKRLRAQRLVVQACFKRLLEAAEATNPEVWHALGRAYSSGRGTVVDRSESIRWYRRAAEAGHAPAMVSLALRLSNPKPSVDLPAAIQWLRTAAERGDSGGMVFLGFAYREGEGVPCDPDEAVRWFTKAVEAGDGHAMIHVGRLYAGYLSSPGQAVTWFLRAAEAGFAESFIELASLYDNRASKVYDPVEANKWYRILAEYSEGTNSRALLALAQQHLDGAGAPCDVNLAKRWLLRLLQAVPQQSNAHREATKLLNRIADQFI